MIGWFPMPDHALAERRSLRYHRAIAERIGSDALVLQRARARVDTWLHEHTVAEYYAAGWRQILSRTEPEIRAFLVQDTEVARAFRQVSPFAGALDPRERWRLWAGAEDGDDQTAA
jgi:hypothetical protein